MQKHRRISRLIALTFAGGCLLQLVGCASGLLPVIFSFAESTILSGLLSGLTSPYQQLLWYRRHK